MTRMNSRKIKLRKEMTDSKASEVFTKMLEKNNKNINNTNKQTLGSTLGGNTAGNQPFWKWVEINVMRDAIYWSPLN